MSKIIEFLTRLIKSVGYYVFIVIVIMPLNIMIILSGEIIKGIILILFQIPFLIMFYPKGE